MTADPVPPGGLDTRRPFTRADALRAGVDPKVLRTSLFRRIFRGVYVDRDVPSSPLVRTEAALAVHPPTAFASHTSAARVCGLPVPTDPFEHITVLSASGRRLRPQIRNHVVCGREPRVVTVHGIRVSHPFRMFVELASMIPLVDLVVVGDAMVRVLDITADRLVEECKASGDRHAAKALHAAEYVRDGVDSPMETRLRMLIVLAGLPEPVVNHEIRDELDHVVRRLDLSYPWLRLIIEYDGRHHIDRKDQWDGDLQRREELEADGWRMIVVTASGIYRHPARTLDRIRGALRDRGCRGVPAQLAGLSQAWCPHFPGEAVSV